MQLANSSFRVPPFNGRDLDLELVDPGSVVLIRAYQHPSADWNPPPAQYRNNHTDPPMGYGEEFAVLYTASNIQSSATEVRALGWDHWTNQSFWKPALAARLQVVRFAVRRPGLFVPLDGANRKILGLEGKFEPEYESSRWVALDLFRRYGHLVHGLSYESFHRYQAGRVYAIWHSRKDDMGLAASVDRPYLADDAEFRSFLRAHPFIRQMSADGTLAPREESVAVAQP